MFPHTPKHSLGVRATTQALMIAGIIALLAFLSLPPGHALAKSHAAVQQAIPSSPHAPTVSVTVDYGVGTVIYNNNQYVFVIGNDGNLWVDIWNGSSWNWLPRGYPAAGITLTAGVGAVIYHNNFYVFVLGNDGNLWEFFDTGYSAQWISRGSLSYGIDGGVGVTVYNDILYVFVWDGARHLWQYFWNGSSSSSWYRLDLSEPSGGVGLNGGIGATVYANYLYVYVAGTDGHVWVDYWNGSSWQWSDNGYPANYVFHGAGVVSYSNYLDVFVVNNNDYHVWGEYWDGYHWQWGDQTTARGTTAFEGAGAIRSGQYLYVYVVGFDHHLWANWRPDGGTWHWIDQGTPS